MYDFQKLRECFPQTTIYKDPSVAAVFRAAKIEAFLRDWIVKRKANVDGQVDNLQELSEYVARIIPNRQDRERLVDEALSSGETRAFLAKVGVVFNPKTNEHTFEINSLGFAHNETIIEDYVWERVKDELLGEAGGWGKVRLGYLPPEPKKKNGRFTLLEFKNFRPYQVDLDSYRQARAEYDIEEWIDVLLGAIDYNPDAFARQGSAPQDVELAKHTMLTRLLPFVEPRVNLIELAPQQTGKSYIFGKIGKYGWLVGGGSMSRAQMFADLRDGNHRKGLVTFNDFVAIDEIKSINFNDDKEMGGVLKGYMEDGRVKVGSTQVEGDAGIIFLGNIDVDDMSDGRDMFRELPEIFRDSALLQRVHGFIPGRYIPSLSIEVAAKGWALNAEYFTEIMHMLRDKRETLRYRALVERLVRVESATGETSNREKEAVFRLCSAYMKLFFPHADETLIEDVRFKNEFKRYCLNPAVKMQNTVLRQMQIINPNEFKSKSMATYLVR